ncbi:MAG TPA: formate dehydrogenase [Burkholderiaceae bacterium]|jgi:ferric-dicitrate binding protein FerR (iron transport regulator)|nr:formate dehydrogenase [Burkholderiaceae bacterium]
MKQEPSRASAPAASPIKRRGVLLGSGAAALAGVAATVAARSGQQDVVEAKAELRQQDAADGYRLTDHVKRYYETIRV